ncbi:DUF2919 family protein [Alteromonas sp. a30]|uniref:DUF2919 family protein n=1 Tax=Alteromonas sp. a30 TaxID=2730917 RepID=UPI0022808EAB|nr:DUF2919 family protein [Alteromonas sp. a30]MCY7294191.1 DUF2919 family protein [Alteromonas sp. a30]
MTPYLPLNHLDQHGRVKPHALLWLIILLLLRPYLVLVLSLSTFGQDSSALLALFYPNNHDFYLALVLALPAWFAASIVSFREGLAKAGHRWVFFWLKPIILLGLTLDVASHIAMAVQQHWRFNWSTALSFVFAGMAASYCMKSRLFSAFVEDWSQPTEAEQDTSTSVEKTD